MLIPTNLTLFMTSFCGDIKRLQVSKIMQTGKQPNLLAMISRIHFDHVAQS